MSSDFELGPEWTVGRRYEPCGHFMLACCHDHLSETCLNDAHQEASDV